MSKLSIETIVAQATPPGRGGVGIIRLSGPLSQEVAKGIVGKVPAPRLAEYHTFLDQNRQTIDVGLVLFFPDPDSFTGEDVIEFHGHGGPVIMDCLLREILSFGVRIAHPGEFSQRAFLNGKIDLSQAEAIADLIDSASEQAARSAIRSLEGEFSRKIKHIVNDVIKLRMYIEAAIDFPDEDDVDFLDKEKIGAELIQLISQIDRVKLTAKQGALLRDGMRVVIAGKPNAGKSSLLNCLCGRESAIVTDVPGTTRDLLREHILIDGIPLHVIDTAGLRDNVDHVEKEGIRRAWDEIRQADRILLVVDGTKTEDFHPEKLWPSLTIDDLSEKAVTVVRNKIDKTGETPELKNIEGIHVVTLCAKTGVGIDVLRDHLKQCVGADSTLEGGFIARRRHLDALSGASAFLKNGYEQFVTVCAGELLAEDLRQCQRILGEITGEFTPDDLLGKIFSEFCIGK